MLKRKYWKLLLMMPKISVILLRMILFTTLVVNIVYPLQPVQTKMTRITRHLLPLVQLFVGGDG